MNHILVSLDLKNLIVLAVFCVAIISAGIVFLLAGIVDAAGWIASRIKKLLRKEHA